MPEKQPGTVRGAGRLPCRLLVVDDEIIMAKSVNRLLSVLGFESEFETDSRRALERIKTESFDVLITDLRMPHLTGVDLSRAARQINPDLIVMIMSANETTISDAERNEAFAILVKPFNPEEVAATITRAMAQRAN